MTSDAIVVENRIDLQTGMRLVHLMSAEPISPPWPVAIPSNLSDLGGEVKENVDEIRMHHLTAKWMARGELVDFVAGEWRRLVSLYFLKHGERVGEAIREAAVSYALATGRDPDFAWIRELPRGMDDGTPLDYVRPPKSENDLRGDHEILLLYAEWMPARAVAVGCGNSSRSAHAPLKSAGQADGTALVRHEAAQLGG